MEFMAKQINDIYELPNANMVKFEEKGCESGSCLVERLYLIKEVSWAATKSNIYINDFTAEVWKCLNIICSRVSPYNHMTAVPNLLAQIVVAIIDDIPLIVS